MGHTQEECRLWAACARDIGLSSLSSSSYHLCGGLWPRRLPSSTLSANPVAAPQDNPGVGSDLLSRFGNEDNAYEDLVEKLAIEDEPGQSETTQGPPPPPKERGNSGSQDGMK
ncbi:hypothetical protein N7536_002778 [Penicillium majusculum]|nr:hypothetical protein N7536_002778 [Penicillium majusculum]